ncbi:hypothetical protein Vretifemale_10405, partial [Volvox reticuliferus]
GVVWLHSWCERMLGSKSASGGGGSGGGDEAASTATAVAAVLLAGGSGDEMAAQLYDLLGDAAFDGLNELMENRKAISRALTAAIARYKELQGGPALAGQGGAGGAGGSPAMPSYAPGVTVNSTSQKLLAKLQRKDAKKGARKSDAEVEVEWLMQAGYQALMDIESPPVAVANTITLANGVELRIGTGEGRQGGAARGALPKGTVRKTYKGYEEVLVPAAPKAPPPAENELVRITDLDEWAQLAFPGYKTLNRIQSRIFRTAYHSNENILVCAPTGAGKTNIAMITVLREVGANMRHGVIQKADFKIVYVAPMKALAAEVTANFAKRLEPLGLVVRELTGDMQLTKRELAETQMIVTTPEKWDVITRKGGDVSVASLVKLLIIDEVHLLNDDRGPVIEALIARTLRQVEASQSMIRIVGLSATLPNYEDVAAFLRVNAQTGLFYFDASYRPVPLEMQFVGVSEKNYLARLNITNEVCYQKMLESLKAGYQVMVFVHSRKDTGKTARVLADLAAKSGDTGLLDTREHEKYGLFAKDVRKSRNREMAELFDLGFGMHHAGMLRPDRTLTERLFAEGLLRVLVCTATLAWGVNLPAHTVIIKGTQVYDAQKGGFTDVGMLDVQQIFGRAGRPQFEDSGLGIILTSHDKLAHYLGMLTHQAAIESQFKKFLVDNLNAEIVLGTVTNVREGVAWLGYSYLARRLERNPLAYGITYDQLVLDPGLDLHKRDLVVEAAKTLRESQMAVFDERSGALYVTELGRVASHFYIRAASMVTFNGLLRPHMKEGEVLSMVAQSAEFEQLVLREEELPELDEMSRNVPYKVKGLGGNDNKSGKANVLMQAWISRARVESFSLTADLMYVSQNAPRIMRAIFEICLRRKWSSMADTCLTLAKSLELRLWAHNHPLRQFEGTPGLGPELLSKLEDRQESMDVWSLRDMDEKEIGAMLRHPAAGPIVKSCVNAFPSLELSAQLQPITRTVLRIQLSIRPTFEWRDRQHGAVLRWHIWVEDAQNEHIYHSEMWLLTKKMCRESESHKLAFTIPIFEPLPPQYYVRAVADGWLGAEAWLEVSFGGLILPERMPPHTELLDLDPLPLTALRNPDYEALYAGRFTHFNPIQTQAFHTLYHTDENVLLGAPTGSGKTISSELTMMRLWNAHPGHKVIYVAPLKALVRERMSDWGARLCPLLGKKMVELTGDYTPDLRALLAADIIICTPEKWDGISRAWQTRGYVKKVGLLIIDEIHLLGADRGPILEVIVSRMRYIAAQTGQPVRFVGLSTALANAQDLADWLGIGPAGLFNFKPSVRPVPLECHIQGYPGKFYCPRMASMNKPAYAAIQVHSPTKPVLVFVSSRRQTRLTALDLITYAVADERPQQFLRMPESELETCLAGVKDAALRHCLQFGIGLHHAGLADRDRALVERLFVECKIQVLVATSTLAWGVNTPAHLVIIKGTEFYDAPTRRYVDFPITDVLQMMGRAGRPQFDRHGVAVILVHEPKKQFYKRFLYEPFPVESSLQDQVADHFNAEVVAGTISSRQDAVDYLTWTYFFRRLLQNPSYYDLEATDSDSVNAYMSGLVATALSQLEEAGCITLGGDDDGGEGDSAVTPTPLGRIASFYYLQYRTMKQLGSTMGAGMAVQELLLALCSVSEFDELPVRHNEDKINAAMSRGVRFPPDSRTADDPHTKANLLLQAHLSRLPPPIADYLTDTKSVLDNCARLLQAMIDMAAHGGWLDTALGVINLNQSVTQGRWIDDSSLLSLPHLGPEEIEALEEESFTCLPQLVEALAGTDGTGAATAASGGSRRAAIEGLLCRLLGTSRAREVVSVCDRLPVVALAVGRSPRLLRVRRGAGPGGKDDDVEYEREGSGDSGGEEVEEWDVELELSRVRTTDKKGGRPRVYAPRFPKVKEEGWYVVVGDTSTRELLALRRVGLEARATVRLRLPTHNGAGVTLRRVTVYLLSDSYLGLDQQYDVVLDEQANAAAVLTCSSTDREPAAAGASKVSRHRSRRKESSSGAAAPLPASGSRRTSDGSGGDGGSGGTDGGTVRREGGGGTSTSGRYYPRQPEEPLGFTVRGRELIVDDEVEVKQEGVDALPQRGARGGRRRGGAAADVRSSSCGTSQHEKELYDDEPSCG